jgi:outer membrane protein
MLRYLFITLTILGVTSLEAQQNQEIWSLQDCILYARQNNIAIKRAQNAVANAELGEQQAKHNRYPNLNSTISGGYQFGRTIDPVSNTFNNTQIGFNSFGLNGGMLVYGGNQINNRIQLARLDLAAAQMDAEFVTDNLSLQIANAYLGILLAEEQLEIVKKRLEQSQQQLDQTDKLIQAGALPENDRFDLVSQVAQDQQSIIDAENQVRIAYLNIQQLMLLDPKEDFRVQRPTVTVPEDFDPDQLSPNEVYVTAYNTQANMKANELRMQSAEKNVDIAKAAFLPRLSIFGGVSTNFSTVARRFSSMPGTTEQTVLLNGEPITLEFPTNIPVAENYPYFDQLNENLGQNIGASISIPIYSNYSAHISTERARLQVINQELVNQEAEQTLLTNINQAIANARAAQRSLQAAEAAVEAAEAAFENARNRFDLGAINSLEFSTARLNLDQAQISLLRAKYSYIFNVKQIEFYQGKTITLN